MFVDREPYIRLWRPTYRVLGPVIRWVKSVLSGVRPSSPRRCRIEARLADFQASQQQFQTVLEQILVGALSDRQVANALANLESRLAAMQEQAARENAAQWAAIEQLLIAFMGSASRGTTAGLQLSPEKRSGDNAHGAVA